MAKPILLIQSRRLGDLILTFPLALALQRRYPENPLHIAALPAFFSGLMPFAPKATFFPTAALPKLPPIEYEAIFNFGSGNEAAAYTGGAKANRKFGEILHGGQSHILGFWQLYRAALTQNNRHNILHWADLNRLDFVPPAEWPERRLRKLSGKGRVGLFIGASEIAKRPDSNFWAGLARRLSAAGLFPLILGGPGEKEAGALIAKQARLEKANFCGKTSLTQLARILATLDLLITPDTGPMHLADWLGTRVLNLSMGNVNAAETGPLAPGQLVLRPTLSCAGCWACVRGRLHCHRAFSPGAISLAAKAIMDGNINGLRPLPGLGLLRTGRDSRGLHALEQLAPDKPNAANLLDQFWKAAFLHLYLNDGKSREEVLQAREKLEKFNPPLLANMRKHLRNLTLALMEARRKRAGLPEGFWKSQPRHSSLFAGWLQMRLDNANNSQAAIDESIQNIAALADILAPQA